MNPQSLRFNPLAFVALIVFLVGIIGATYFVEQSDFMGIMIYFSLSFGAWVYLLNTKSFSLLNAFLICVFAGAIPLFSFPNLSDDIYRFLWDGGLIFHDMNPYLSKPADLIGTTFYSNHLHLFDSMNSQEYNTVYPVFLQTMFAISYALSTNLEIQTLILKLIFFFIHGAGLMILMRIIDREKASPILLIMYGLNPLVLVEGIGNLHAEIIMVPFLFGFFHDQKTNPWRAALFLAVAIAIKILPALLLIYLFYKRKEGKNFLILKIATAVSIVFFIPVIWGILELGFTNGLGLYFQKFEFNASLYYLLRYIGYQWSGHNLILYLGPLLALISLVFILRLAKRTHSIHPAKFMLMALVLFFICSPIIHPWYLIGLVALSIFTDFKFPLIWSFTILFSYIAYNSLPISENMWLIGLEYLIVFIWMWNEKFFQNLLKH